MQWNGISIKACGSWLGTPEPVADSVAAGRYDAAEAQADEYEAIRVADIPPAEMAVHAGRLAVERAGVPGADYRLVAHASVGYQGLDHWAPGPYIQRETVGGTATSMEIKQASNGGIAALEMVAAHLSAQRGTSCALVTTADRYNLPDFDRYRSDKGLIRGDGATGVVLSNDGSGVANLLSSVLTGDVEHERVYRGDLAWGDHHGAHGRPANLLERRVQYLTSGVDTAQIVAMLNGRLDNAIAVALDEAGVDADKVARFVLPNSGVTLVDWESKWRLFGITPERTTWPWGCTVGHIGAGDQLLGMTRLLEQREVVPGDHVVLVGTGTGFTFGSAVVQITELPQWTHSAV